MKTKFLLITFLFANSLLAIEPVVLTKDTKEIPLGLHLDILEDKEGKLTLDDIRKPEMEKFWVKSKTQVPSFGFSDSAYWFRFELKSSLAESKSWFLEIAFPPIDYLDFYLMEENGKYTLTQTGDRRPFDTRQYNNKNYLFNIPIEANKSRVVYIKSWSHDGLHVSIPMVLYDKDFYIEKSSQVDTLMGIFIGILLVMFFYNLFIYISIKDISYLYYILYLLGYICWTLFYFGYEFQYFWQQFPGWANQSNTLSVLFFVTMQISFSRTFLSTNRLIPRIDLILKFSIYLFSGYFLLSFVLTYSTIWKIIIGSVLFLSPTLIIAGVICFLKGYRPAKYYLISWTFFLSGGVLMLLKIASFIPSNFLTENSLAIGSVSQVITLSLGLADRINDLKKQNELARIKNQEELEKLNSELEQKVIDRTFSLNNALQKSDKLLLNILPEEVAEELKEKGNVTPVLFDSTSIMFTDFKGFTQIAEGLTPRELIKELDGCFTQFDNITERYNLEKLKTIGDSYMCAGGIPKINTTHAIDCCLAALEIQSFMNQMKGFKQELNIPYWELRLGIHSGPVMAGVVGEKKFAYDIWGDTVNTASRMESSGTPGRINISYSTYELVKEFFDCEYRGEVNAKNKGLVKMYYLNRIKQEFAKDKEGHVPNEKFWARNY
jgi:class 3 adenylate cyclase